MMRRKEMREVEVTYCDICGDDITCRNQYGYSDAFGNWKNICSSLAWWKPGALNCEKKFLQQRSIDSGDSRID